MMLIRKAQRKDIQELLDIYNYEVIHGVATFDIDCKTMEEWTNWFDEHQEPYVIYVSEINGCIAGYASLSKYRYKQAFDSTVELSVYVNPLYRNQQVASKLMEAVIEYASKNNIHTIVSVITSGNTVSEYLHKKFHFEYCGTIREVGYKMNQYLSIDHYQIILK